MKNQKYRIIKYSPEYKESLLELLKTMWKDLNESEIKEQFKWRYERNPYHQSPYIYLAVIDEKVVGFRAFVLHLFTLKKSIYQVFSPTDAIVNPDYRRKGIFSALNEFFLKDLAETGLENALIVNLSSNKYSTPGYLKQDWQVTDGIRYYAYRISLLNIIKRALFNKQSQFFTRNLLKPKDGVIIEITQSLYAKELSDFVANNRVKNRLNNLRDEAYYNWRYSHKQGVYYIVYYRVNGELKGFVIIKRLTRFQYSLEEYLAIDRKTYSSLLKDVSKILSVPVLRTWILSPYDRLIFSSCSFIKEPLLLLRILRKHRLPILVRPVVMSVKEDDFLIDGIDTRKINNWQLYLADKH